MDAEKIRALLEHYWNCETTIEEENALRKYFNQDNVPEDLMKYKSFFRYFHKHGKNKLDAEFDKKLLDTIEKPKKTSIKRNFDTLYKVAAAILLILSFIIVHQRFINVEDQNKESVQDTFEDPRKALEETKKILFYVSAKWNKGKEEVSRISKFNEAEEIIRNAKYKEI